MSRVSTILMAKRKREALTAKGICVRCKIKPSRQNRMFCDYCTIKSKDRKRNKKVKLWKAVKGNIK